MERKLIDIPVGELFEKFGAGSHKPGSGSAASLMAMLSAKMVVTVIDLTKTKKSYKDHFEKFNKINEVIEKEIYPELIELFQKDSEEFDKAIMLRRELKVTDAANKKGIEAALQKAMKIATEIPMRIAVLCLDLADFGIEVFDHGYRAVRGDSGVGLNAAISGISSCLYIIDLNLLSISPGEWMEAILEQKQTLMEKYRQLLVKDGEKHDVLDAEREGHLVAEFEKAMAAFRRGNLAQSIRNDAELEEWVRELQNALWTHRERIWDKDIPEGHEFVLRPEVVLTQILGYKYAEKDSLGQHEANRERFEVAGIIDKGTKLVQVSKRFSPESMRFTAAHELGHALLHEQPVLHRDRAVDGAKNAPRVGEEAQADKFAALFLMPARSVRKVFKKVFERSLLELSEGTALLLRVGDYHAFRVRCGDARGFARFLAGAEYFRGQTFTPLARLYGVSVETMAIRLEELGLVKF